MKLVFVHIPKTAGNSVRRALAKSGLDIIDIGHSTPRRQGLLGKEYFRFCFVRDPYSRLRSAFYHLIAVGDEPNQANCLHEMRVAIRAAYGDDFNKFVLDGVFEKVKIAHFFPQSYWTHRRGISWFYTSFFV